MRCHAEREMGPDTDRVAVEDSVESKMVELPFRISQRENSYFLDLYVNGYQITPVSDLHLPLIT